VSSKAFTAQTFAFLHQVNEDKALIACDLKVALTLTKHFNERDDGGRAYPSYDTLAAEAGVSEATVIRSVRRMEQHGHLRVVWGQPGRGHPNQYWMIIKASPVKVLCGGKASSEAAVKASSVSRKASRVKENLLKNQEGLLQRPSIGEREEDRCRDLSPVPAAAPDGAAGLVVEDQVWMDVLCDYQRGHPRDDDPKEVAAAAAEFDKLMTEGVSPLRVRDRIRIWIAAYAAGDGVRYAPKLVDLLRERAFEKRPPPPKRRRARRGEDVSSRLWDQAEQEEGRRNE
jgi:hypothetical protein